MTTTPVASPVVHIETGPGVNAASIDYALDALRQLCAPYPVASLRVRMTRTGHPAMPTAVLADASAAVLGRTIRVRVVGHSPHTAIDALGDRLADKLTDAAVAR